MGEPFTRAAVQQRRLPYAGNAIDQDIICQLIYPITGDWDDLSLANLNLPLPGEPDLEARYALQQQLEASPQGEILLNVVREMKPGLCCHDVSAIDGSSETAFRSEDFYNWVLSPYLQQLNRELNLLLSQSGTTADTIQRVVCTGGTGSIPAIAHWLQRKFPQAEVIQDAAKPVNIFGKPYRDRIAAGLALLPRFPHILDRSRHQYNDYFLFRELLKAPIQSHEILSASQILQRLDHQGIDTAVCKSTLLNFLEGQLPTGLVPSTVIAPLLTTESRQNAEYHALLAAPLFTRQDRHLYQLNPQQRDRLWSHLQLILANTHQTLEAPLLKELEAVC